MTFDLREKLVTGFVALTGVAIFAYHLNYSPQALARQSIDALARGNTVTLSRVAYARPDIDQRDSRYPDELALETLAMQELAKTPYGGTIGGKDIVLQRIGELNPGYTIGMPAKDLRVPDLNDDGKFGTLEAQVSK